MEEGKYINPYTDFGFKKLFGTEMNKDLLISFLNSLLEETKGEITDVEYLNGENLGDGYGDRRSVFDVYCRTKDDTRFIVEMQKAEQAPKGKWNYHLDEVCTIGILNFTFPKDEYPADSFHHVIKLMDVRDKHVFYDKLTFRIFTKLFEQAEIAKYNPSERR